MVVSERYTRCVTNAEVGYAGRVTPMLVRGVRSCRFRGFVRALLDVRISYETAGMSYGFDIIPRRIATRFPAVVGVHRVCYWPHATSRGRNPLHTPML